MGKELTVALSIRNLAELAQAAEVALHSYFAVSHIDRARVFGLEHLGYLDQLTGLEHVQPANRSRSWARPIVSIKEKSADPIEG